MAVCEPTLDMTRIDGFISRKENIVESWTGHHTRNLGTVYCEQQIARLSWSCGRYYTNGRCEATGKQYISSPIIRTVCHIPPLVQRAQGSRTLLPKISTLINIQNSVLFRIAKTNNFRLLVWRTPCSLVGSLRPSLGGTKLHYQTQQPSRRSLHSKNGTTMIREAGLYTLETAEGKVSNTVGLVCCISPRGMLTPAHQILDLVCRLCCELLRASIPSISFSSKSYRNKPSIPS